MKKEEMYNHT
ncbi:unnamed protein product, partial [Allacma fusca]